MTDPREPARPVSTGRMPWLDAARGIALVAMATYHFMWDLSMFGYLEPGYAAAGWPKIYARTIASTFLFLVGFSLVLAHGRGIGWPRFWKRWLMIVAAALAVTAASYFAMPQGLIHFGILHAIAAASLIGLLFLRLPPALTFLIAAVIFITPFHVASDAFNEPWLWWVGLSTQPRQSFDYVPLLPWLAPALAGIGTARLPGLVDRLRQFAAGDKPAGWLKTTLAFFGRHSLVFYLVHQPLLISILYGVSLIHPASGHPAVFLRDCQASCLPDASEDFCRRYCRCALDGLERGNLLGPLQSGAMPEAYRGDIDKIRSQCTVETGPVLDENGN
ncbi:MAG: DUF1624 domain-containing protein [Rhizobiaceae bacterium]|nr:DUF1624 domain-containing protein [Rhizobiaceae bacterium]